MAERAPVQGNLPRRLLCAKEWAVAYTGPTVRCFQITFASWLDPKSEGGQPAIEIYLGDQGDQNEGHLAKSLAVGETTEVCGTAIRLHGVMRGDQVAHWQMSEDGETEWFE
jgi:hypothetical protein